MIVGLTGGIGSGKSYAANLFKQLGVPILDADEIAHQMTATNGLAIPALIAYFGSEYLTAEGSIDRAKLRQHVFQNPNALAQLNAITHPLIRAELDRQTKLALAAPYIIQVIPLLIESQHWTTRVDRILVVDCAPETQIARVMQRSQLSRKEVLAIMSQQATRAQRLSHAHDILDNQDNAHPSLTEQVARLHQYYLQYAQHQGQSTDTL